MSKTTFCKGCSYDDDCDGCNAIDVLYRICDEQNTEEKRNLIREYAKELGVIECEVSDELRELGEKVIAKRPELSIIREFDVKVGYVLSYKAKKADGKIIAADCQKVTGSHLAFLPFDFVVTFYEPNMDYMTENQKKILMLHELKHIGIGPRGLRIEPHDIEDFRSILFTYGLGWNEFNNDEVPDILADEEEKQGEKKKPLPKGKRKG